MSLSQTAQMDHAEHATLVFEREIPATVQAVFGAFSDAALRAKWGTPSATAVVLYDSENFVEGGEDKYRCGSKDNPNIHATTHYLEIIENRRIVSSETLVMNGNRLCASLTTLEFAPTDSSTKLKNTTQMASFVGKSMLEGFTQGNNASLDNLVRYFQGQSAA